ncbi:MAG TPA: DUF2283 domain-containing protein [Allocoleopsis sp.]
MNAKYDIELDILRINWVNAEIQESDSISPGVILDYDTEGNVIGIEILKASHKIQHFPPLLKDKILSHSLSS